MIRCQATNKSSPKEIGNATSLPQVPFSALSSKVSRIKYVLIKKGYTKLFLIGFFYSFPFRHKFFKCEQEEKNEIKGQVREEIKESIKDKERGSGLYLPVPQLQRGWISVPNQPGHQRGAPPRSISTGVRASPDNLIIQNNTQQSTVCHVFY